MGLKAFIIAGGKGTRLRDITHDEIPKPMVKLNGKPILEYTLQNLIKYGVDEVYISVGYMHEKISEYFGDGKHWNIKIEYIVEKEPLGSAGALYYVKDKMNDDFIVCTGDAIFDIDISRMLKFHKENNAIATLLTHPNCHPYDSDLIIVDKNNIVQKIDKKGTVRDFYYKNNVNAGFFIFNPASLYYFDKPKKASMEWDFVNTLIIDDKKVMAYKSCEYFKDVGTPERYYATLKDLENGIIAKKCLKNKQKAIFLDRDGTINKYVGFLRKAEEFQLVNDATDAIGKINKSEYLAIIISNQPVIARGECSFEEEENIMNKMETLLGEKGVYLDGIYYCPHHPHSGFEGEVKELKIKCECRKPAIGLINKAVEDFNLDLSKCYFVGDSNLDIDTAKNANIPAIRVKSDMSEECPASGKYNASSLSDAIDYILNNN